MKKIIATVLAMVMALALCTTAFAASAYGTGTTPSTTSGHTYELKAGAGAYKDNVGTFFVYDTTTATNAVSVSQAFVKVTKAQAEYTIVVDTTITYLAPAATFKTSYDDTGVAVATVKELDKCGDIMMKVADTDLYKDSDGDLYVPATAATATTTLLVGDTLVKVRPAVDKADNSTTYDYEVQPHKYVVTTAKKDGKTVVTALSCSKCNQTFDFRDSESDAIKAFGLGKFTRTTVTVTDGTGTASYVLYIKDAATGSAKPTGSKPSPKTFDAGIALYAAMALTSVAGSAVVIGKKKEF